jgi:hypothetical protein
MINLSSIYTTNISINISTRLLINISWNYHIHIYIIYIYIYISITHIYICMYVYQIYQSHLWFIYHVLLPLSPSFTLELRPGPWFPWSVPWKIRGTLRSCRRRPVLPVAFKCLKVIYDIDEWDITDHGILMRYDINEIRYECFMGY